MSNDIKKLSILNSPYSLISVMLPFMNGLSGETLNELALALNINHEKVDETFESFMKLYSKIIKSDVVKVSNILLSNDTFKIKKSYVSKIKEMVTHETIGSENLVHKINKIVERETGGMICNFLKPGEILNTTLFAILNTIYFYSDWDIKFSKANTKRYIFFGLTRERDEYIMILKGRRFQYCEQNGCKIITMNYTNLDFTLC